jgi:signal transduction histidine kinase
VPDQSALSHRSKDCSRAIGFKSPEVHYDEKMFCLRVRDNGKGMDAKAMEGGGRQGHYGLPGMSERAKLAGGKLGVFSKVDSGTEVELTIPASRAYTK